MPAATLRLFIAAYPTPPLARTLLEALPGLALPDHRPAPPEQVHLTMLFLGERRVRDLPDIEASVRAAAAGIPPFRITLDRLEALPERGPARLIAAVGAATSPLIELHTRLAARLVSPKRRGAAFLPHLTLARFPGSGTPLSVRAWPLATSLELGIDALAVMSSVLATTGAVHRPAFTVPLA